MLAGEVTRAIRPRNSVTLAASAARESSARARSSSREGSLGDDIAGLSVQQFAAKHSPARTFRSNLRALLTANVASRSDDAAATADQARAARNPSQERIASATTAPQLAESGTETLPIVMEIPTMARASCSTAITAKMSAAIHE